MEDFTITIEAARKNRHMSQKEAAEKLGISVSTLGRWEKDESKIPTPAISGLADVYQTPRDLFACLALKL